MRIHFAWRRGARVPPFIEMIRENIHLRAVSSGISQYGAEIGTTSFRLGNETFAFQNKSIVIVARHPGDQSSVVTFLAIDRPDAIAGLARKLPHYGKYSYLVFEGSEPSIIAKGTISKKRRSSPPKRLLGSSISIRWAA